MFCGLLRDTTRIILSYASWCVVSRGSTPVNYYRDEKFPPRAFHSRVGSIFTIPLIYFADHAGKARLLGENLILVRNAIGGLTLLSAISATRERQKQLIVVVTHCPLMLKLEYRKRLFFYSDA